MTIPPDDASKLSMHSTQILTRYTTAIEWARGNGLTVAPSSWFAWRNGQELVGCCINGAVIGEDLGTAMAAATTDIFQRQEIAARILGVDVDFIRGTICAYDGYPFEPMHSSHWNDGHRVGRILRDKWTHDKETT